MGPPNKKGKNKKAAADPNMAKEKTCNNADNPGRCKHNNADRAAMDQVKAQELDMLQRLDWRVEFVKPHDFVVQLLAELPVEMSLAEREAVQRHAEIFVDWNAIVSGKICCRR